MDHVIEGFASELVELVNDHDSFVKIEALETFTEILEFLDPEYVKSTFIPIIK